jgi:tetratricopeptide (TPR) repeat protein
VGSAAEAEEEAGQETGEEEAREEEGEEEVIVDDVRALREAGRHEDHLAAAKQLVAARPSDVLAQIEAAYGHDRNGFEREAVRYYDEAYQLGRHAELRRRFLVGYGSTLRNVGRQDDAVAILGQAVVDDPAYPAYAAFLALALLSAGHPRAALAAMLGLTLDVARPGVFDGYERALVEYHQELLEQP